MAGRTVSNGYGAAHKRLRKRWAVRVEAGEVMCARCGGWIAPGSRWELDHKDDRSGYLGVSHRSCNRLAGLVKGGFGGSTPRYAPPATGSGLSRRTSRRW